MKKNQQLKKLKELKCKQIIEKIDHTVYVTNWHQQDSLIQRWHQLGFIEHYRLETHQSPALHIAFKKSSAVNQQFASMIGLSVSKSSSSPINEFIRRYGEGIQHHAYSLNPQLEIQEIYQDLQQDGWDFLTPILTYYDRGDNTQLHQFYTKPSSAYGHFIEFTQRPYNFQNKRFSNFDDSSIEEFYQYYDNYSQSMEEKQLLQV